MLVLKFNVRSMLGKRMTGSRLLHRSPRLLRFVIVLLCFIASPWSLAQSTPAPVTVTIESDILRYAKELLGQDQIKDFSAFDRGYCQRDVVEFILVQKALQLGGSNLRFRFSEGHYDAKNVKLVIDGFLLISFDTVWLSHVQQYKELVYISEPMIRHGEYEAAVYVGQAFVDQHRVKTLADLQQLSFVSSRDWPQDWRILSQINPKQLVHETEWVSMAKMVSRGWVDAMLVPFTRQQPFVYQDTGYRIQALPGIKVAMDDSRHFIVSKKHPQGAQTFAALQKGLAVLRASGEIESAYQKCGFFNQDVADWQLLNESLLTPQQ